MINQPQFHTPLQVQIVSNLFWLHIVCNQQQLKAHLFDIQTNILYQTIHQDQSETQNRIGAKCQTLFKALHQSRQAFKQGLYQYGKSLVSESSQINITKQLIAIQIKNSSDSAMEQFKITLHQNKTLKLKSILQICVKNYRQKLEKQIKTKYLQIAMIQKQCHMNNSNKIQKQRENVQTTNSQECSLQKSQQNKSKILNTHIQKLCKQNEGLKQQLQRSRIKVKDRQQEISKLNNSDSEMRGTIRKYRLMLPQEVVNWIQPQRQRSSSSFSIIMIANDKQTQYKDESKQDISNSLIKTDQEQFKKKLKQFMQEFLGNKQCFSKISDTEDIGNYRASNQSQGQLPTTTQIFTNVFYKDHPYYDQFKVDGPRASYLGSGLTKIFGGWCQLMINQIIPRNMIYRFKIKIVKSDRRAIIIGIVDRKKECKNKTPNQQNTIGYYGRWGKLIPTGTQQGTGFFEGETVQVKVKMSSKMIKWSVGTEVRAKINHPNLGDPNRQYVPYIEMRHSSDIIEWCGSTKQQSKAPSSFIESKIIAH